MSKETKMKETTEISKMTITRGLTKLKLLDKRINKEIRNSCFITSKVGTEIKNTSCNAESDLQSVSDLINYRVAIKAAIMKSNATTIVKINDETMTVAEAIEKKSSIEYFDTLLDELREQRFDTVASIERTNNTSQDRLDRILESTFGKELKARPTEITEVSETFWKANKAEIHDTIQIDRKIDELDEYLDSFRAEVDLCLSESNSTTFIEA